MVTGTGTGTDTAMATPSRLGRSVLVGSIALLVSTGVQAQESSTGSASASDSQTGGESSRTAATGGSGISGALGQGLRLRSGVRLAQTWTSAAAISNGREEAGFITEVSPYARASVQGPRLQGNLSFSIRNFYRTETPPGEDSLDLLRYTLDANAHLSAPGGRYGLRGAAFVRDINFSSFGITTSDASVRQENRRRYAGLRLAPYTVGQLGSTARYFARYTLALTDISQENALGIRAQHSLDASLSDVRGGRGLGWALTGATNKREYSGGFTTGSRQAAANLYYGISPDLRIGISANYSQVDRLNIDGKDHGVGPGISVYWTPSPRTSFNAQWVDQFYGNTSQVSLTHRARRFTFGLGYSRGLLAGSDASLLMLDPNSVFNGGTPRPGLGSVADPALQQYLEEFGDPVLVTNLTSDIAVYMKRMTASFSYAVPRGSMHFTVYRTTRDTAIRSTVAGVELPEFTGELEQHGVRVALRGNLNSRTSLHLIGRMQESESTSANLKSRYTSATAAYQTRITNDATASLGVRRSIQKGSGGAWSFDENAVFGTLDLTF